MRGLPFTITYEWSDGVGDRIALDSMQKIWVDRDCSGIVFAEAAEDGSEMLHEVVIGGAEVVEGMADVMATLLGACWFERLEAPIAIDDRARLVLEFRYPNPHPVALAFRA